MNGYPFVRFDGVISRDGRVYTKRQRRSMPHQGFVAQILVTETGCRADEYQAMRTQRGRPSSNMHWNLGSPEALYSRRRVCTRCPLYVANVRQLIILPDGGKSGEPALSLWRPRARAVNWEQTYPKLRCLGWAVSWGERLMVPDADPVYKVDRCGAVAARIRRESLINKYISRSTFRQHI